MDLSKIVFVNAQSHGNALAQGGDGDNEASQREEKSQLTNQKAMCVSGESTSLSCNNLSSENIDRHVDKDVQDPISMEGRIYQTEGETDATSPYVSRASCNEGDSALSGYYHVTFNRIPLSLEETLSSSDYAVSMPLSQEPGSKIQVFVQCFDNP